MQYYATTNNTPDAEVSPKFNNALDLGEWLADGADVDFTPEYYPCDAAALANWMFKQCEEWVLHICR